MTTVQYGVFRLGMHGGRWLALRFRGPVPPPPGKYPKVSVVGVAETQSEARGLCRVDARSVRARAFLHRETVRVVIPE